MLAYVLFIVMVFVLLMGVVCLSLWGTLGEVMANARQLRILSLSVAFVALAAPPVTGNDQVIMLSLLLALVWTVLVTYGLFRFKKQGLWLLIGAPGALLWPYVIAGLWWGCSHDLRACP